MNKNIVIKGAREHNLKNIDLTIPRDKLIVFTGLSGSGKSSLAFDTIYAEGQRRYVESLSSYARQFLGQMEKPDVDYIDGLSPAISIDQKTTSRNPRSTVGTVTEIYDYLRLLYARIGTPHCTKCGREITQQTVDQIVDRVMELDEKTRIQILAPIVKGRKGEFVKELDGIRKSGFVRVRVDGSVYDLSEEIKLEKNKKHNIDVIVDRLVINDDIKSRLTDSVETATHLADGNVVVDIVGDREELFSLNYACPEHGAVIEEMSPRMFSFNNPFGACKKCGGLGSYKEIDPDLVIPNKKLSINQGAVKASGWSVKDGAIAKMYFEGIAKEYGFSLDVPVDMIPKDGLRAILYGTGGKKLKMKRVTSYGTGDYQTDFEGVIPNLKRRYESTSSEWARGDIEAVMTTCTCPDCKGARLTPEIMSVTVGGKNIYEFCSMPISEELDFVNNLELTSRQQMIGKLVINEIRQRLSFLNSVGLDYLSLAREAATLSGGEAQRIRLATQIGSSLMGVLYILDEPSIGLHQRDNLRLINSLKELRDMGNSVIVVEHVAHRIKAEAVHAEFLQPVAAVGEQKAPRHFLTVVKGGRAPLIEFLAEKVAAAVVAGQALLRIGAGVAVGDVQNHGQAQAVGLVHQHLELVRRAVARTGREIAADLIAEGAVQGVLQNAHELHGGVAVGLDPGQDGAAEFLIAAHAFAVMGQGGLRHAHVSLINAREDQRAGAAVAEAVGLLGSPKPRAPLGGHGLVLFHPLGEGGNAAQRRRAQAAFVRVRTVRGHGELNAQFHVVAVRQGIRRQDQLKDAVFLAPEAMAGMALKVQLVRGQPDGSGLGHVFAPAPAVHAPGVSDAVRAQAGMQIGIGA